MKGKTMRHIGVAVVLGIGLLAVTSEAHAQTALRKAGRGLAGMTIGFLEIPGNIYKGAVDDGVGGAFLGFAKGLGMLVPRTLVGVYEFVSAPIPAPSGFRPILEPEFPWGYFSGSGSTSSEPRSKKSSRKP